MVNWETYVHKIGADVGRMSGIVLEDVIRNKWIYRKLELAPIGLKLGLECATDICCKKPESNVAKNLRAYHMNII